MNNLNNCVHQLERCLLFCPGGSKRYTLHDDEDEQMPLKWYECQPVFSKKIVMMHLQPESETCVSIIWSGNTWNYRNALDEARVPGARFEDDDGEGRDKSSSKYYRILKSLDVSTDETRVQNILKEVFQNLAMKVIVDSEPIEDSDVFEFIQELRKLPNLHFEK